MDKNERLKLNEMIKVNNVEDVTEEIRNKRHSFLIKGQLDFWIVKIPLLLIMLQLVQ